MNSAETPHIDQGIAAYQATDWRRALRHFDAALAANANEAFAYQLRGATLLELGRFHNALKDFNQAIQLSPYNELGYLGKARAFAGLKDYRWAVIQITNAIDLIPEDANASDYYRDRADFYDVLGERQKAQADRLHAQSLEMIKE